MLLLTILTTKNSYKGRLVSSTYTILLLRPTHWPRRDVVLAVELTKRARRLFPRPQSCFWVVGLLNCFEPSTAAGKGQKGDTSRSAKLPNWQSSSESRTCYIWPRIFSSDTHTHTSYTYLPSTNPNLRNWPYILGRYLDEWAWQHSVLVVGRHVLIIHDWAHEH